MSGYELVNQTFAGSETRARYMPYFPIGYPDLETSITIIEGLANAGADVIEIGVPFSDPIADGPTNQAAMQIALENGVTLPDCIKAVGELRNRGVTIPLLLMGYVNPLLAYGQEKLMQDATAAGVSGFIVPDFPPDEAGEFQVLVEKYDLALPYLLAPTSNEERIKLVGSKARGFIYMVSVTGVTGAREKLSVNLEDFIKRTRQHVSQPLVVGFGISSPEKAVEVGKLADGVIIGSKLVTLAKDGADAVINFSADVRQALDKGKSS